MRSNEVQIQKRGYQRPISTTPAAPCCGSDVLNIIIVGEDRQVHLQDGGCTWHGGQQHFDQRILFHLERKSSGPMFEDAEIIGRELIYGFHRPLEVVTAWNH